MAFPRNHKDDITAANFFVKITITFWTLFVSFVIDLGCQRIIHMNVATNPTAHREIQQNREAFPNLFWG